MDAMKHPQIKTKRRTNPLPLRMAQLRHLAKKRTLEKIPKSAIQKVDAMTTGMNIPKAPISRRMASILKLRPMPLSNVIMILRRMMGNACVMMAPNG